MKEALVSIVIPFYNEEKLLSRAIDSAINQNYSTTEIILVNDGSTDTSKQIADTYCKLHSDIFCIHSPNESLGAARNKGIQLAKGEYIIFLDADDELLPEMIETMLYNIIETKSDVAICKFDLIDSKGSSIFTQGFKSVSSNIISQKEACIRMYNHDIAVTAWAKMYKTKISKSIKFPEGLWFEDRPYLLNYFLKSDRISFVEKSLLKIHSRSNSITRRVIESKRIIDHHVIFEKEMNVVESSSKLSKAIVYRHLNDLVDTSLLLLIDGDKIEKLDSLQNLYLEYVTKFKEYYRRKGIQLNLKKKILLKLIELPRFLSWKLSNRILKIILKKKYQNIKLLKTS